MGNSTSRIKKSKDTNGNVPKRVMLQTASSNIRHPVDVMREQIGIHLVQARREHATIQRQYTLKYAYYEATAAHLSRLQTSWLTLTEKYAIHMAKADRIRDAISLDSSVGEERLRMILGRVEATHKEERAMVQSLVNLHHEIVAVQEKMSGEGVELREWGMRLAGDRERLGKRERRFSLDDFDDATYYV